MLEPGHTRTYRHHLASYSGLSTTYSSGGEVLASYSGLSTTYSSGGEVEREERGDDGG
jgi:hypothetical protein